MIKNGKWYTCAKCGKNLSSYKSLWRHRKSCSGSLSPEVRVVHQTFPVNTPYDTSIQTCSPFPDVLKPKQKKSDPRIEALVNAIVNANPEDADGGNRISRKRKLLSEEDEVFEKRHKLSQLEDKTPHKHGLCSIISSIPIDERETSDSDDDDESSVNSDKEIDYSFTVNDIPIHEKVVFLPREIDSLEKRFTTLFREFWRESKHKHRNELVIILDELLNRNAITRETYKKLNSLLAQSLGAGNLSKKQGLGLTTEEQEHEDEEMEEEKEEEENMLDEVESKISDTLQYLIQHDRREIEELLQFFEKTGDTYWEDDVVKLRELVELWIEEEILGKETVLDDIKNLISKLKQSKIPKSKLIRFKSILNDIRENRHRVTDVIRRMVLVFDEEYPSDAEEQLRSLKQLVRSKGINDEQYNALKEKMEDDNSLNLDNVIWQLKQVKVGRGIAFLPRLTNDLFSKLKDLIASFAEEKTEQLRDNILRFLDELLQRKAISKKEYNNMKTDNNIE